MRNFKVKITRSMVLAFSLALFLSLSVFAANTGPYGVLLSWAGDPSTSMTAAWRDSVKAEQSMQVVAETQYDKTGFTGAAEFAAVCKDVSLDSSGAWGYEATAAGLRPSTVYAYRVGSEGSWSAVRTFTTADPTSQTLTFAYLGDVQTVSDSAAEFALWGKLAEAMYRRNPELAFAVMGGDIVESGISLAQFDLFRENAESVFSCVPLLSTIGNHESNFIGGKPELFLDLFAFPQNGPEGFAEEFYSFDVANCHVLVLNSWIFSGEQNLTQADYDRVNNWIKADLAGSTADWQIVVTHIPTYAVHSDNTATAVKANWAPIFEQYGVDLVFEGHQHVYRRSYPIYEGKVDYENGVTYIMGVSGSKFYDSADETLSERTIYNTSNYQLVQIDGSSLTVQTLDINGNELDFVSIPQRSCTPSYTDVAADSWYAEYVDYVTRSGLFDPTGDGSFGPDAHMTRLMLAEALYRLAGNPAVADKTPFDDCDTPSVIWAYTAGVVDGRGGGLFDPQGSITRQEIAAMFYRYAEKAKMDLSQFNDLAVFSDSESVAGWALVNMKWAVGAELINGMEDGTLLPNGKATRAQVAAITMRFAQGDYAA